MEIDPQLLEIIVCPADHGQLRLVDGELVCATCGNAYPVLDGMPVLLLDEARTRG